MLLQVRVCEQRRWCGKKQWFFQLISNMLLEICGDQDLHNLLHQIDLSHISMSYASFVIIWHFMSYDDIENWNEKINIWSTPDNNECKKGKQFPTRFYFFKFFCGGPDGHLDTKISQIYWCHISMSYDIKGHIMTNDAYDIEIWHKSIWSTFVSKRTSGPQQSHLFIRF